LHGQGFHCSSRLVLIADAMAAAPAMLFGFRPPARRITIRCKVPGGAQFEIDVDPASTVQVMKHALGSKLVALGCDLPVPTEQLRLLVKGHFLEDTAIVKDCKVVPGSQLLLMRGAPSVSGAECPAEAITEAAVDVIREYEVVDGVEGSGSQGETSVAPAIERVPQTDTTRCWACAKHIALTAIQCRCGYWFCSEHRYAECHQCDFDHQTFHREVLQRQLLGCDAEKVEKV